MQRAESLRDQVAARLGYVPPFLEAAAGSPTALEILWSQMRLAYLDSALPARFKESLLAYLARYCTLPYCLACHCCELHALGMSAGAILDLVRQEPPGRAELRARLESLPESNGRPAPWPEPGSPAESAVFWCAVGVFLQADRDGTSHEALRRTLTPEQFGSLMQLLAYARCMHMWMEAHPQLKHEDDPRARNLPALMREEPALEAFLRDYRHHVSRERREREQRLLAEITRRDFATRALEASEARNRLALLHAPFPVMIYAEDLEVVQINDIWTELSGYTLNDLPTVQAWFQQAQPDVSPPGPEDIEALYAVEQRVEEGEHTILTRHGGELVWDFTSAPLGRLPDGRRAVLRMAADVTERRHLEQALWDTNRRVVSILESINDGFFALDHDWRFVYANQKALDIIAQPREALIGRSVWEAFPAAADAGLRRIADEAAGNDGTTRGELQAPFSRQWFEYHIYPSTEGFSVYFRDVTERKLMAEAFARTHQQLQELVDSSPLAIIVTDVEARVTLWSPAAERIFGWSAAEVLGEPPPHMTKAEVERFRLERRAAAQAGHKVEYEAKRRTRSGEAIDVRVWGSPLRDAQGRDAGAMALIADITLEKIAASELRQAEQVNRALLAAVPDIMFQVTRDGTYVDYVAVSDVPMVPPSQFLGRKVMEFMPAEVAGRIMTAIGAALDEGRFQTVQCSLVKDGQLRHYELRIVACGENQAMVIARNITGHRRAEETLQELHQTLQDLVRATTHAVIMLDLEGNVRLWNHAAEALFGWTEQEVIGRPLPIVPESRQVHFRRNRRVLLQGQPRLNMVVPCQCKDGRTVSVNMSIAPVHDASGHVRSLLGILFEPPRQP